MSAACQCANAWAEKKGVAIASVMAPRPGYGAS